MVKTNIGAIRFKNVQDIYCGQKVYKIFQKCFSRVILKTFYKHFC